MRLLFILFIIFVLPDMVESTYNYTKRNNQDGAPHKPTPNPTTNPHKPTNSPHPTPSPTPNPHKPTNSPVPTPVPTTMPTPAPTLEKKGAFLLFF